MPASATRKVSRAGPPIATHRAVGAPAWLMASLPQGNAQGQRSRTASAATHQPATASGHARSRSSSRWPTASTAKTIASAIASAAQTYQATLTSQESSGTKNARPKARPTSAAPRNVLRQSATASRAGPAAASGHAPTGGNAAARARPPAMATGTASRVRRPPESPQAPAPEPGARPAAGRAWRQRWRAGPARLLLLAAESPRSCERSRAWHRRVPPDGSRLRVVRMGS